MSHLELVDIDSGYDTPIRVLRNPKDVVAAMTAARRDFTERLARGGLTVTAEAAACWWPVATYRAALKDAVS